MKTPYYKRWWFWLAVVVLVLVVAIRIALNPLATHYTQAGLDELKGYTSRFESVSVSVIPPGYTIERLEIRQDDSKLKDALVYVDAVEAKVILRKIFRGQIVAVASVQRPKVSLGLGDFKPPKVDAPPPKKSEELDLGGTLQSIIPFRIDRFEVRKGQLLFVDATEPEAPRFWVKDLELAVDNIASRRTLDQNVPVALTMSALVQKSGKLSVFANADVLQKKPAFSGQGELTGLKLADVYGFAKAKAGLSPKGTVDCFINFNSVNGRLSGEIKPMIKNAHIEPADEDVGNAAKAGLANAALGLVSDRVEGRNAVATTLPIKGTLENPDPQVWPTILGVVRNAFVEGVSAGFGDMPLATAAKKQGPITQAAEAFEKDENAPKAQPSARK